MIAGTRLASLSGLGSAAAGAHLAAIGAGGTAAARLVAYSRLASATAAVHLMTDAQPAAPTETAAGGFHAFPVFNKPRRRPIEEDEAVLLMLLH